MPPSQQPSPFQRRMRELGTGVGDILCAVGETLRQAKSARHPEAERALFALSVADVTREIASIDVVKIRAALTEAAEAAFEVPFAEDAETAEIARSCAVDGLFARDRAASIRAAARRLSEGASRGADADGGAPGDLAELERRLGLLDTELAALDGSLQRRLSRMLTGVNPARRAALARLSEQERERAWWYAARAEEDALLPALGGMVEPEGLSEEARAELALTAIVSDRAREDALGGGLRRTCLGLESAAERAELEASAERDPVFARALELARLDVDGELA